MRQLKITKQVTNRETASLDKYLQEIGRVDLITAEEEVELARRIKKGDQVALEKLTKANLRFVVSVSKQYQNQGLSLPDLINEGNLGLIKAAQRFDETRGFNSFLTLFGGFDKAFFRHLRSRVGLFVCP
jgi:RNA polymerase primary sigma factor